MVVNGLANGCGYLWIMMVSNGTTNMIVDGCGSECLIASIMANASN